MCRAEVSGWRPAWFWCCGSALERWWQRPAWSSSRPCTRTSATGTCQSTLPLPHPPHLFQVYLLRCWQLHMFTISMSKYGFTNKNSLKSKLADGKFSKYSQKLRFAKKSRIVILAKTFRTNTDIPEYFTGQFLHEVKCWVIREINLNFYHPENLNC